MSEQVGAHWDDLARWWADGFTSGADAEYDEQILPMAVEHLGAVADRCGEARLGRSPRLLDLGCGEGQIARLATAAVDYEVVGVDSSFTQVSSAIALGGGPAYMSGHGEALALRSESFDAVMACLVFEHIADADSALDEIVRVLRPGGSLIWLLNHPLVQTPDSGWIDDHTVDPPEQYWQLGPYLTESETVEQVDNGVFITFFHRPLSRHINAAIQRGLVLETMVEPAPPAGFLGSSEHHAEWATVPRLLLMRFHKS